MASAGSDERHAAPERLAVARFLDGRLATSYMMEGAGTSRYALSWDHRQRLGRNRTVISSAEVAGILARGWTGR